MFVTRQRFIQRQSTRDQGYSPVYNIPSPLQLVACRRGRGRRGNAAT